MFRKVILILFLFYILALIQGSFLVHFTIFGVFPNLVLIFVLLINIFTPLNDWFGVVSALIGGFFLDIFSAGFFGFFGFYTLVFLTLSLFFNFILKKYVEIPFIKSPRS